MNSTDKTGPDKTTICTNMSTDTDFVVGNPVRSKTAACYRSVVFFDFIASGDAERSLLFQTLGKVKRHALGGTTGAKTNTDPDFFIYFQ